MSVFLGLIKSTTLYLCLAVVVTLAGFGVKFSDAERAASNPRTFADFFLASGWWSLPILIIAVVIGVAQMLLKKLFIKRYREYGLTVLGNVFGGLGYAFVNPFDGLRAPWVNKRHNDLSGVLWLMSKSYSIIHFAWSIALVIYLAAGLTAVYFSTH